MEFQFNDGGRKAAGFKGHANDCVIRAIAIAVDLPYIIVAEELRVHNLAYINRSRSIIAQNLKSSGVNPKSGVYKIIYHSYLLDVLGWKWVPAMQIGIGCTMHLNNYELPKGKIIVRLSRHISAVIDGVLYDTHDVSRNGTRCVYGYYHQN